jgi:methionyl-tRNA formyltransferase
MGTPEFAVASLDALVCAGCQIVGVVTAPDKPAGRGMKLMQSDVKKYAVEKGLHLLQPEKLKNPEFLSELKGLQADVQVVVAFRMLPELVWNMPPMGTINLHGSLLPQYRGAAPIHWAVINGEVQTGVTTFKLQHAIDTGDILLQDSFAIGPDETTGDVHDRMKLIGASLLVKTIAGLATGNIKEQPQALLANPAELKHAPKLFTENCQINWNRPVQEVHNFIRGLSPFPGALSKLDGKILKIYRCAKDYTKTNLATGTVVTDGKTVLKFATEDGFIQVLELQLEGKKRMLVTDFLRGYRPEQDQ